jgi:hypothetical protein
MDGMLSIQNNPVYALKVTPGRGSGPAGLGSECDDLGRQAATILALLREPLAGATVHTLPGTPRHPQAEFKQLKRLE